MGRIKCERNISYDERRDLYYVYMDLGSDATGQRCRQYRTYSNLNAARKALRQFTTDRDRQNAVPRSPVTLEDWLERWMHQIVIPNRAETTVYGYRKIIDNHIVPMLGDIPLQRLAPSDLQDYYASLMMEKELTANTVRRHHDLLSAALHSAVRQDLLLHSPTDRVEPPHVIPHEARFYNSEDLKRLYGLLKGHPLELAAHLAASLGLRREEMCGLHWGSVDFELRKIHIREARTTAGAKVIAKETKNHSSTRVLHMGDDIFHLLRRERTRQYELKLSMGPRWPECGLVLVDKNGDPEAPNLLTMRFSNFVRSKGLPPITLHGLRHSFATVASAQGVPLFDISKALGHSTPATTGRIYTHLVDQLHTGALDAVAAALR